jgi:hypothetical protein
VHFTGGGLDGGAGGGNGVVRAVHAALGRRLLVLLNGHEILLGAARKAAGAASTCADALKVAWRWRLKARALWPEGRRAPVKQAAGGTLER